MEIQGYPQSCLLWSVGTFCLKNPRRVSAIATRNSPERADALVAPDGLHRSACCAPALVRLFIRSDHGGADGCL